MGPISLRVAYVGPLGYEEKTSQASRKAPRIPFMHQEGVWTPKVLGLSLIERLRALFKGFNVYGVLSV